MATEERSLRLVRVIVYVTTIFYGVVNAAGEQAMSQSPLDQPQVVTTSAFIVGIIQFIAAIVAFATERFSVIKFLRKWCLFWLSLAFFYEFVLIALAELDPFRWTPLLVYSAVCAVLYLSEG